MMEYEVKEGKPAAVGLPWSGLPRLSKSCPLSC